jgi:hypothetical protein
MQNIWSLGVRIVCDKLRFYIIWYFVIPVVVYGSEIWSVTVIVMKRLGTRDRKILRKVHGPAVQQGIWRIRNNHKIRELYKYLYIKIDIQNKGLEWTGHVLRRDQDI